MALITIREYMEQRRKCIDRYVQGEHRWLGDVDAHVEVTYNVAPVPWYCKEEAPVLK
jgi:hypothetical protein